MKKILSVSFFVTTLIVQSCCTTNTNIIPKKADANAVKEYLNERINQPFDRTQTLPVVFATNRRIVSGTSVPKCSNSYFSPNFNEGTSYGVCDISVPMKHEIGTLDSNQDGDSNQYFKFTDFTPITSTQWIEKVKNSKHDEVILFVHGFNVLFEEAVLRAAQMKYDLKFPGEIVLYTWPAGPTGGIFEKLNINGTYKANQQNAKGTIPMVKQILRDISSTGKKVHVIVHSMGHQIVLPAISELSKEKPDSFIEELILNAPDFPTTEFHSIKGNLKKASKRITVYCSPGDKALVASRQVNENERIGSCEKISGVDMINVNEVDDSLIGLNHGYYSSRQILTDLYQLLLGVDAQRRLFIRNSPSSKEDYILRK
ncbi:MAG: alpha/beta hydrolase [Leptospiraceae bacterium]|nr:alpha/beta hydrolase [Leptospiraceae bacterium]MCP5499771.1 alpha/beta hydrolase [Leptospiraceae bacterium]